MVMVVIVIMVVMMIVVLIMIMLMHSVGSHDSRPDSRQADRVMWMVGAVAAANGLCRGRSREERQRAEASYCGSSKNESVTGDMDVPSEKQGPWVKHCSCRLV